MSQDIPVHFIQEYSAGIELLAQQLSSETRAAVRVRPMRAKKMSDDQIGIVKMQPRGARHADIPTVDTPHKRRWVTAKDYHIRDFIDEFDKLQILTDPTNGYSQAFAAPGTRQFDKIVIDAVLGTAYTGEEGTTSVTLPAGQKIAAGGGGFTLAKLKQAVRILKTNNAVMPGDEIHAFWTARQEEEFIDTNEVKSSDFNTRKVLVDGGVNEFYRVAFHLLEDVEDSDEGRMLPKSGTTRSCALFCKSGVLVGERKPAYGRIAWLDERETWQVSAGLSVGATRLQEKKVVQIDVVES